MRGSPVSPLPIWELPPIEVAQTQTLAPGIVDYGASFTKRSTTKSCCPPMPR